MKQEETAPQPPTASAKSNSADQPVVSLGQKITPRRAGRLALVNSDKTPRLVPPSGGFREAIKKATGRHTEAHPKAVPPVFQGVRGPDWFDRGGKSQVLGLFMLATRGNH